MILLMILLLAILPVFFWSALIYWWDRKEPEPLSLFGKLFLIGAASWTIIALLINALQLFSVSSGLLPPFSSLKPTDNIVIILVTAFIIASIHEIVKMMIARSIIFKSPSFSQTVDGIVYLCAVSFGAALAENLILFTKLFFRSSLGGLNFSDEIFPFIFSTLVLGVSAGFSGLALGRYKMSAEPSRVILLFGLSQAVFVHTSYRFFILIGELRMAGVVALIASFYLFSRFASKSLTAKLSRY